MTGILAQGAAQVGADMVGQYLRGIMDQYNPATNPQYSSSQAQEAANENQDSSKKRSSEQTEEEMQRALRNQMATGRNNIELANLAGYGINAAANANTAMQIARRTAEQMNDMYATAGQRLNNATANTLQALGNASGQLASIYGR